MDKEKKEKISVHRVAESKVWYFFGSDFSLKYCRIATNRLAMREDSATAAEVFETLGLHLFTLSQIFVARPHEFYTLIRDNRWVQAMAATYNDLGLCRTQDEDGWIALAKLVNKEIRLIVGEPARKLFCIYYPSGELKRIQWYHRFLNLDGEEIEEFRWYHRWLKNIIDIFSEKHWVILMRKEGRANIKL